MGKARNLQFVGQPYCSSCTRAIARCEIHIWQCFDKSAPRQKRNLDVQSSYYYPLSSRLLQNQLRIQFGWYVRSSDISFNWFTIKKIYTRAASEPSDRQVMEKTILMKYSNFHALKHINFIINIYLRRKLFSNRNFDDNSFSCYKDYILNI